ncbi:molecular chaperone HscC [bacterium 1XD42-94]|jgi:molecular chaperone HscC|nr:molecular chaperone HscC [bacterium 1XD42-76]NBK04780.1 molecular chaperone HscC [bacterium 1XD42-94]
MAVIGIDLGTTNSLAAVYRNGEAVLIPNALSEPLTPSVVNVDEEGMIWTGAPARERQLLHPEDSASSFKRFMGTGRSFSLRDKNFTPQELSALILKRLKEEAEQYLGEPVEEAVISVPAYFNDNQRKATKDAGILAGLKVERLINEPSAAALAVCQIQNVEEASYLVFDFGGGTLDVSVVDCFENVVEIAAVSGDNHLGGNDFDLKIAESFCEKHGFVFREMDALKQVALLKAAEKAKCELTQNSAALYKAELDGEEYGMFLTNQELVSVGKDIFERIFEVVKRALKDSHRTIDDIDEVILAGGSSKMPVVALYLEEILEKKPVVVGSPDYIVALGAGYYAGIKERNEEIKDVLLTDICPFTLGTDIINPRDRSRPLMSPIIERNSVLPTSKCGYFMNAYDGQKNVKLGIYQGESYYCDENIKLGEINMEILPRPRGQVHLEVRFTYDINGILEVEVYDRLKEERVVTVLTGGSGRLSEEELKERLAEMKKLKTQPIGGERVRLVMARGERLFKELTGSEREIAAMGLKRLNEALSTQNDQLINHVRKEISDLFDNLEAGS